MPEGVRWTTPGGGPTLWLELPKAVALNRLGARLHDRGVSIESTTTAFEGEPHLHGFRVSYAFLPPETLERAVEIVGTAIAEELSHELPRRGRERDCGAPPVTWVFGSMTP
jgi:DNA-binding transcriptional MocR family regulator